MLNPVSIAHEVGAVLGKHAGQVDEHGTFPEEGMHQLKQSGLMGLLVPREYGGFGASYSTMSQVAQVLASGCLSTGMIWAMHCQQVATIIDHAPQALLDKVLPRIAYGEMFVASVTSEREKGGHLLTAFAPLLFDEDDVVLRRDAPVVTGGAYGDSYLITMRASEDSPPSDVVLVFADRSQLDIEARSGWSPLGMRGTDSAGMSLQGRFPKDQMIDPPGGFEHVAVTTMIPVGHIAWASAWLGAAQGCYMQMIELFRDPKARKGFNLQSDLFASRLARIRLQLDSVSAYLQQTVQEYEQFCYNRDNGTPEQPSPRFNIHINNLKIFASETLFAAIDQLLQLSGLRYGYLKNNQVCIERTFRDLRAASLMYANDRLLIANGKLALLDRNALFA
jgi:alkylation response protein AidB-like acyl-CoA dehydrogenase